MSTINMFKKEGNVHSYEYSDAQICPGSQDSRRILGASPEHDDNCHPLFPSIASLFYHQTDFQTERTDLLWPISTKACPYGKRMRLRVSVQGNMYGLRAKILEELQGHCPKKMSIFLHISPTLLLFPTKKVACEHKEHICLGQYPQDTHHNRRIECFLYECLGT